MPCGSLYPRLTCNYSFGGSVDRPSLIARESSDGGAGPRAAGPRLAAAAEDEGEGTAVAAGVSRLDEGPHG